MQLKGIIGVGIDIADIGRFRKLPYKKNKSFYQKIFTKNEISYCLKKADPYQSFAARFAAKEAIIKCMPVSVTNLRSIEIMMNKKRPQARVKGFKILLSMAHENNKAIAVAICL